MTERNKPGAQKTLGTKHIKQQWADGKNLTGICYSTGKKQYFLVMTEQSAGQLQNYFTTDSDQEVDKWWKEGRHPTIIFRDPSDNKVLIVMTSDSSIQKGNDYVVRTKHGLIKD